MNCHFEKKFNMCMPEHHAAFHTLLFKFDNDVDALFVIRWLQYVLLTILQPVFGLMGIINNLLIIVVVRNKAKKKEFKDPMYHHIRINAAFNVIYCGILVLKLVNTCIFHNSSVYCSSVYQWKTSQYFKIIVVFYLGNVAKMCSNISYLSFSLSRLIVVSMDNENKFYKKFKKINFRVYIVSVILFSGVMSIFLLLQYELNTYINYAKEFPYEIRDGDYCQQEYNKLECHIFNGLKLVNSVLTSVICVLLNIVIDASLLNNYTHDINKKLHMDFNHNKIEELKKKKKKVTKMVIIYGALFFVSHAPEFVTTLMLIVFANRLVRFCIEKMTCDLINEEAEFFNLISIACNFYIFRVFDKNFKESVRDLENRLIFYLEAKLRSSNNVKHY